MNHFIVVADVADAADDINDADDHLNSTGNHSKIIKKRMIGGDQVSIEIFPWTVLVIGDGRCGGALIDVNWVLTAAHCIRSGNPVTVYYGIDRLRDMSTTKNKRQVVDVYKPHRSLFKTGDIALLKLNHPIPIRWNSVPIRLNDDRRSIMHRIGIMAGFGRNHLKSDQLMAGRFFIQSAFLVSTRDVIGARAPNYSPCYGDSGSGLVVEHDDGLPSLVGITSSILAASCQPNHMALFSDVSFYRFWILDIMNLPQSPISSESSSSTTTTKKVSPFDNIERRISPPSPSTCWPVNLFGNFKFMFCTTWFTNTLKAIITPWKLFF